MYTYVYRCMMYTNKMIFDDFGSEHLQDWPPMEPTSWISFRKKDFLAAKMRQCPGQLQPQKNPKDIYIYIYLYIYTHTVYLQLQDVTSVREG